MTRFKKELRKLGLKLECDYEYLPCNGLECVVIDQERAEVRRYYNFGLMETITMGRDMSCNCVVKDY